MLLTNSSEFRAFAAGDKFFPLDKDGVFRLSSTHFSDTWAAMEKLLATGKTKAIGISNFNVRRIKELLATARVVPATNQIEAHPYIQQQELFDLCKSHNILIEAYSPLGNNQTGEARTVDDATVHAVGDRLGMDAGQVLVSWGVQRGTVVLPKSVTEKRIQGNFQDKILPDFEFNELNKLERHKRFNNPSMRWGYDIFDEDGGDAKVAECAKGYGEENKTKFTV